MDKLCVLLTLSGKRQALKIKGEHPGHVHISHGNQTAGQVCVLPNLPNMKLQITEGKGGKQVCKLIISVHLKHPQRIIGKKNKNVFDTWES